MSVDHPFAVFRIETVLDNRPCIAEVEHELAWTTNDLVGAFGDAGHFLDGRDGAELFGQLVLLPHRIDQPEFMVDIVHVHHGQNAFGLRVDVIAPKC